MGNYIIPYSKGNQILKNSNKIKKNLEESCRQIPHLGPEIKLIYVSMLGCF